MLVWSGAAAQEGSGPPQAIKTGDIAGAVVAVVKDGEIVIERGYGCSAKLWSLALAVSALSALWVAFAVKLISFGVHY